MKVAIMAAGTSEYFPFIFDKPKCLYHVNGTIQLENVIDMAVKIVPEEDIIVVAGYKSRKLKKYLETVHPRIKCKINRKYNKQAIFSFRTAIENENDDILFVMADETIKIENARKLAESNKSLALLVHDEFYYFSVGILKIKSDKLHILEDNNYLSSEYMKKVYCFANNKQNNDGKFLMNSGICLGYIVIDLVRRIGGIDKVKHPSLYTDKLDVDFIHYCPQKDYINDLDIVEETDEYKTNPILRLYMKTISRPIKKVIRVIRRIIERSI